MAGCGEVTMKVLVLKVFYEKVLSGQSDVSYLYSYFVEKNPGDPKEK